MARRVLLSYIMMTRQIARNLVVAATLVGAASSPVLADKAVGRADSLKMPKLNCGESYVLGQHRKAVPTPEPEAVAMPKTLSDAQIAEVVKGHIEDVQYCWNRLPAKQRAADASVVLALSIAPKGDVVDTTLIGDAPAEAKTCIAKAIGRWTFPVVELASDIEYPVALRAR